VNTSARFRVHYNSLLAGYTSGRSLLIYFTVAPVTFVTARHRPQYLQWAVFPFLPPPSSSLPFLRDLGPTAWPPRLQPSTSASSPLSGVGPTSTETNEIFDSTPERRPPALRRLDGRGWVGMRRLGFGSIGANSTSMATQPMSCPVGTNPTFDHKLQLRCGDARGREEGKRSNGRPRRIPFGTQSARQTSRPLADTEIDTVIEARKLKS